MAEVMVRHVRGKWQFGRIMPNSEIFWYAGNFASALHAYRAAEHRIEGYRYERQKDKL